MLVDMFFARAGMPVRAADVAADATSTRVPKEEDESEELGVVEALLGGGGAGADFDIDLGAKGVEESVAASAETQTQIEATPVLSAEQEEREECAEASDVSSGEEIGAPPTPRSDDQHHHRLVGPKSAAVAAQQQQQLAMPSESDVEVTSIPSPASATQAPTIVSAEA